MAFHRRRPPVGARPGTLAIPPDASPPRLHVFRYDPPGVREEAPESVEGLGPVEGEIIWVDVQGIGDEEVLWAVARAFGIHPLALEDVANVPQRPKVESYDGFVLLITRMLTIDGDGRVDEEQLSLMVGDGWVVTIQERYGDVLEPVRRRIREGVGRIRKSGADYLAYAIVDTVVDGYYPVVEDRGERIEAMEEEVFERPSTRTLHGLNDAKRDLLRVRRALSPQREALNRLVRDGSDVFADETRLYVRDTYDHCVQLADVTETQRELINGLLNTYLSVVSNRMNEIMKVLTIMASIFIPLTFFAGIYGMNFDHMPELHSPWGYPALLALMVVTAIGMVAYFRRKGWIGGGRDAD